MIQIVYTGVVYGSMRHWNHRLKIYGRIRDEGYLQKLFACSTMTSNKQTKEGE